MLRGLRQLGDSGKHIGELGLRVDVVELGGYAASSNAPGCGADLMPRGLLRMLTIEKPSKIELDSSAIATAAGHPTPQALRNALAPQRWTGNLDASACTTTFAGGRRVGATLRDPSSGGCGSGQRGAAPSNTCRVTDQCQSYALVFPSARGQVLPRGTLSKMFATCASAPCPTASSTRSPSGPQRRRCIPRWQGCVFPTTSSNSASPCSSSHPDRGR